MDDDSLSKTLLNGAYELLGFVRDHGALLGSKDEEVLTEAARILKKLGNNEVWIMIANMKDRP